MRPSRRHLLLLIAVLLAGGAVAGLVLGGGAPATAPPSISASADDAPARPEPSPPRDRPAPTSDGSPPPAQPDDGSEDDRRSARLADHEAAPKMAPTRLLVPAIGIDAPIDAVEVADGELEVVDDAQRVGWYRFGPSPGDPGTAVLAAHVATAADGAGVFVDLDRLRPGDVIEVEDEHGVLRTFEVGSVERHGKDRLPVDELFVRSGEPQLALITCGGEFDPDRRSYQDNVVVIATPA